MRWFESVPRRVPAGDRITPEELVLLGLLILLREHKNKLLWQK